MHKRAKYPATYHAAHNLIISHGSYPIAEPSIRSLIARSIAQLRSIDKEWAKAELELFRHRYPF